ncbi:hypothetical protein AC578_10078 [Pseudocercospora eumusae]|uniref:Uncharacterized protein n=1 Tax=Pseudocercospora eumusae TaxID=321146 RepID=A0A139H8D8_9PEZI|nr:hypothetical protein AC578_10078 [Pseudocercospora eumusae]
MAMFPSADQWQDLQPCSLMPRGPVHLEGQIPLFLGLLYQTHQMRRPTLKEQARNFQLNFNSHHEH